MEKLGACDDSCHETVDRIISKDAERPSGSYVSTRRVENRLPQILRSTTTIVACPYQTSWHRAGVLAALENRNPSRKRRLVSIDTLYEAPAASGHVVDKFGLVQLQTVKVD